MDTHRGERLKSGSQFRAGFSYVVKIRRSNVSKQVLTFRRRNAHPKVNIPRSLPKQLVYRCGKLFQNYSALEGSGREGWCRWRRSTPSASTPARLLRFRK